MSDKPKYCTLHERCKNWKVCGGCGSIWCFLNYDVYQAILKEEDEKFFKIILAI